MQEAFRYARPIVSERAWRPAVDVCETPEDIIIVAELAGVRKEEIEVTLDSDLIRIAGRRAEPAITEKLRCHQLEINFGEFERILRLSSPIIPEKVTALYQDGFLQVTLPKRPQKERERIEINVE